VSFSSKSQIPEPLKKCSSCLRDLPLSQFYQFRVRETGKVRWEKFCRECKRRQRRSDYQSKPKVDDQAPTTSTFNSESQPSRIQGKPAENATATPKVREDGQAVFKEYVLSDGEILQVTKEEFERVVDVYRLLAAQDSKMNGVLPNK
jgi:hypothetical protein